MDVNFGTGEQTAGLSGQHVTPVGRKTHFGPLSENNTFMAVLHAGLLVIVSIIGKTFVTKYMLQCYLCK